MRATTRRAGRDRLGWVTGNVVAQAQRIAELENRELRRANDQPESRLGLVRDRARGSTDEVVPLIDAHRGPALRSERPFQGSTRWSVGGGVALMRLVECARGCCIEVVPLSAGGAGVVRRLV
jgi:hypothetical protein